jgi:FKBP-type peptidyl-prolyl cis-trans isomerase SlyD
MSQVLAHGKVGMFHYTLSDSEGAIMESSVGGAPMAYLHGFQNIIPGLESALEGKSVGESFKAVIPPAEAYGERRGPGPQGIHRSQFPKGFEATVGRPIQAQGSDGEAVTLWITKVEGAQIYVDINHPLAGQTLTFDVQIVGLRDATSDEMAHGHAHGEHGHHH